MFVIFLSVCWYISVCLSSALIHLGGCWCQSFKDIENLACFSATFAALPHVKLATWQGWCLSLSCSERNALVAPTSGESLQESQLLVLRFFPAAPVKGRKVAALVPTSKIVDWSFCPIMYKIRWKSCAFSRHWCQLGLRRLRFNHQGFPCSTVYCVAVLSASLNISSGGLPCLIGSFNTSKT